MSNLVKQNTLFPSSFMDQFFGKDFFDWSERNFMSLGSTLPSVNLKETDKSLEIEMAAPGLKKEDFKIELKNNILSISSEKKEEKKEKDKAGNYTRREFNYQSFMRSFTVPENASDDQIKATYANGILNISIGKKYTTPPTPVKQIEVK